MERVATAPLAPSAPHRLSIIERSRIAYALWRVWQITICLLFLLIHLPLLLVVAALIKLQSAGPVFYRQERVGKDGSPFQLLKFRSLKMGTEQKVGGGFLPPDQDFSTPIGRFIRKTKIDEIPQLFNIILGDMNFVGPRPIRTVFYRELVTGIEDYKHRFCVKPGVTGLPHLLTPYKLPKSTQLKYDLWHIENRTLWIDTKILILTVVMIVSRVLPIRPLRNLFARMAYGPDDDCSRAFIPLPRSLHDRREQTALETWASNNPGVPEFHYQLALFLSEQGYLDESIQKFKDALALDTRHTKARIKLGYAYALDGQYEKAIAIFEEVVCDNVNYPDIFCTLGILWDLRGDHRRGMSYLRRALQLNPRYRDAQVSAASMVEKDSPGRAPAPGPERPSLQSILFRKSCVELKYDTEGTQSLEDLERAVIENPGYADLHHRLGNRHADMGQWDRAIQCFERAIAINANYTFAHVGLGQCHACLDDCARAIACYDRAIAGSPHNPDLLYDMGVFHYHLGQLEQALDMFERAFREHPVIFQENGEFLAQSLAHRSAQEIEQWMHGHGGQDQEEMSLKVRGDRLFIQGKYTMAQAAYQRVLESDRSNTEVWRSLGIIYRKRGFYALALQNFQVALDLAPHDQSPLTDLGLTMHLLGGPEAQSQAQRSVA
jgi:lipopolysaccharide/colanic/teichoic acid biosynthesis glycosyltransferase/tetratricopeptide (TPR) repeat protein